MIFLIISYCKNPEKTHTFSKNSHMKNKPEEKSKISFIFFYINRIKEFLRKPPIGFFNILVTFRSFGGSDKDLLDIRHEITLGNYYFDLTLLMTCNFLRKLMDLNLMNNFS